MTMHRVNLGLACFFVFILKHWCNIHHKHINFPSLSNTKYLDFLSKEGTAQICEPQSQTNLHFGCALHKVF